jgi:plastocyanin
MTPMRARRSRSHWIAAPLIATAIAIAFALFSGRALFLAMAQSPDEPPVPPGTVDKPSATVQMTGALLFQPETVAVRQGDSVLWHNDSPIQHTVTDDPRHAIPGVVFALPAGAEPFDSREVDPGRDFEQRFDVPGTYRYACVHHGVGGMVGVVQVAPRPQ